ncbi:hypothetical protein [Rhizobium sullae]|nr:hypothetical protein [Rhizobium sullae]
MASQPKNHAEEELTKIREAERAADRAGDEAGRTITYVDVPPK